ncbi:MAG: EamA family transporter [Candidatus Limnocylindria bacterium]
MIQPGVVWGVATGAAWGVADFAGGIASRRAAPIAVTAGSQVIGLIGLIVAVAVLQPGAPALETLALGAVAGFGGGLGLAFLYQALATGSMGLVSALSGAGASVIPLLVTVALGADLHPLAVAGVGCVVAAAVAASDVSRDAAGRTALLLSFGAAIGFATWYLIIDRAAEQDALWALVASRSTASLLGVSLVALTAARASVAALARLLPLIVAAGGLDVAANVFFVIARDAISVALAAPLSGLYPLATMVLARIVLGERLPRLGLLSVLLAVGGIVLISVAR